MASKNQEEFNKLLDNVDNANEDVLVSEALEDVRDTLEIDDLSSTLQEFDKNQSAVTRTEDWQFSSLMIDKLLSDERYEEEKRKYYEEIAKNANLDLSEGAENTEAQYQTAFNHMTALKKKTFEKIAPIAYSDLQAELDEMMPIQRARKMLLDAGVKVQDAAIRDEIAESLRLGYAFDQKFGDPNARIDFAAELKKEAPGINKAFETLSTDKAKKYAMMAAMGIATGGSSIAMQIGIGGMKKALTSDAFLGTMRKAGDGFDSFLQKRGVNTGPLKNALKSLSDKTEKGMEKLSSTRWGKALIGAVAVGGAVAVAAATGHIDLESIGEKTLNLGKDLAAGAAEVGGDFVDGLKGTGGPESLQQDYDYSGSGQTGAVQAPEGSNAKPVSPEAQPEAQNNGPSMVEQGGRNFPGAVGETQPGANPGSGAANATPQNSTSVQTDKGWSHNTPDAPEQTAPEQTAPDQGYMDPRDNMVKLADVQPVSLTVEPGSSVYETVKAHMAEANGFPPSEQAVMQASSDIIAESGIDDPSKVPAGFEFDFNAQEYAYVDSVSQETVDIARFGADGIPDGMKGQTLGEIAAGKFDAVGPVETRTTGQLMTEGAINGAVKSDIVNSIDKGLDPNMTIDDYMATMEKQVAAYESNVPPVNLENKSNLAASLTNEKMANIDVPEGHAGPTESAGNKEALAQHYQERHDKFRDQGLGR